MNHTNLMIFHIYVQNAILVNRKRSAKRARSNIFLERRRERPPFEISERNCDRVEGARFLRQGARSLN